MGSKYCSRCESYVAVGSFAKNCSSSDGLQCWCKQCFTDDSHTLHGVVRKIYSAQRRNSRVRGHPMPLYSLDELRVWCFSKPEFIKLHSEWVDSDFERDFAPSLDRLRDNEGYSFDNIQVMTWKDNMVKGHNSPHVNRDELCKDVLQYSKDGKFIAEYHSVYEAGDATGIYRTNISSCCIGRLKTAGKFVWKFKV